MRKTHSRRNVSTNVKLKVKVLGLKERMILDWYHDICERQPSSKQPYESYYDNYWQQRDRSTKSPFRCPKKT
jgi:hypothetical protein